MMNYLIENLDPPFIYAWISKDIKNPSVKLIINEEESEFSISQYDRPDLTALNLIGLKIEVLNGYSIESYAKGNISVYINDEKIRNYSVLEFSLKLLLYDEKKLKKVSKFINKFKVPLKLDDYQGLISDSQIAIIGKDDYCFIYRGLYNLFKQYIPNAKHKINADRFVELLYKRQQNLSEKKIRYYQIINPNKSSILNFLCPYESRESTLGYEYIINSLNEKFYNECFIDIHKRFRETSGTLAMFRKYDSHMAVYGCILVIEEILRKIIKNDTISISICGKKFVKMHGDLRDKYRFKKDNDEYVEMIDSFKINNKIFHGEDSTCYYSYDPEKKKIGRTRKFTSKNYLLPYKIVIFGTSHFGTGETCLNLTWWLAKLFKETVFMWSIGIDYDFINNENPDIVLSQIGEYLISYVPSN